MVSSTEGTSKFGIDALADGWDIVLQTFVDTEITLTIKELTTISSALGKSVSAGNFVDISLKNLKTPSLRANIGRLKTINGHVNGILTNYREGDHVDT